jgi:hypothetical protein
MCFAFPDTSFACGLPRVAVGAKDLTLCDLNKNCRPGETGRTCVSDVVALLAEMVELEHDGISLAAFRRRDARRGIARRVTGSRCRSGPERRGRARYVSRDWARPTLARTQRRSSCTTSGGYRASGTESRTRQRASRCRTYRRLRLQWPHRTHILLAGRRKTRSRAAIYSRRTRVAGTS